MVDTKWWTSSAIYRPIETVRWIGLSARSLITKGVSIWANPKWWIQNGELIFTFMRWFVCHSRIRNILRHLKIHIVVSKMADESICLWLDWKSRFRCIGVSWLRNLRRNLKNRKFLFMTRLFKKLKNYVFPMTPIEMADTKWRTENSQNKRWWLGSKSSKRLITEVK